MSRCLNQVLLVGFVGSDPKVEIRGKKDSKKSYAYLRLYTIYNKESRCWHNLVAFGENAEAIGDLNIKKDSHVLIRAHLNRTKKVDSKTKEETYETNVIIDSITLLDKQDD